MTIEEFLNNEELVKEYQAWINSPIASVVLGLIRDHFLRPLQPGALGQLLNEHSASYCLGENAGSWKIHDAIRNLAYINEVTNRTPIEETYPEPEREPENEE